MSEQAVKRAEQLRQDFWEEYERALGPENASKREYLAELEELSTDVGARIDAVREELRQEEKEDGKGEGGSVRSAGS